MNTEKINLILSRGSTAKFFRGTFPSDMDFEHFKPPYCCITNTDSHNGKGAHWNAWFVTKDRIYFFDSFGRKPTDDTFPPYYKNFVKIENKPFIPASNTTNDMASEREGITKSVAFL